MDQHQNVNLNKYSEIQEKKTELLFKYLRDNRDLNRELWLLELSDDLAELNHLFNKKLTEVLLREGK